MSGVSLRRRHRPSAKQSSAGQSDAPVTVVFRAHTDSLSKAPFLYYPKNYNLPMPSADEQFTEAVIELCVPSCGCSSSSCVVPTTTPVWPYLENGAQQVSMNTSTDAARGASSAHATPLVIGDVLNFSDSRLLSSRALSPATEVTPPAASCGATAPSNDDSWVCRAYCFGEKDALHTNGAISVHQSLANKSQFINDITKGKATARVLRTYEEVRERFGLSHVELAFEAQSISRADMFLLSEALRDQILYEGQELALYGFSLKVSEMLRTVAGCAPQGDGGSRHINNKNENTMDCLLKANESSWATTRANVLPQRIASPHQQQMEETVENRYRRVRRGLVTELTLVNFRSLSAVHYIILEISTEMWNPTMDGRITLDWAVRKFLGEYLVQQVPKHKASPLLRILMVGRLHPQYAIKGRVDVFHMMQVPPDYHAASLAEEVKLQCEVLLQRVLEQVQEELQVKAAAAAAAAATTTATATTSEDPREITRRMDLSTEGKKKETEAAQSLGSMGTCSPHAPDTTCTDSTGVGCAIPTETLTERDLFVHSKNVCIIEAISLVLEHCKPRSEERNTGFIISIVSAGKGLYRVVNDLLQATCTRLFNVGIEKVNILCIGRPPLHTTPLLEYTCEDGTLRTQCHLHVGQHNRHFYERPQWARCYFYHPAPEVASTGLLTFELLTKEEWLQRHLAVRSRGMGFVPGLGLPLAPQSAIVLPLMNQRNAGQSFVANIRASGLDVHSSPMFASPKKNFNESIDGAQKYSVFVTRPSGVCTPLRSLHHTSTTDSIHEDTDKSRFTGAISWRPGAALVNGIIRRQTGIQTQPPPFVMATWYFVQNSGGLARHSRRSGNCVHELIIYQGREEALESGAGHATGGLLGTTGIIPCGMNILDTDLQSGYMLLKLHINLAVFQGVSWSSQLLISDNLWGLLMGAFHGRDARLLPGEQVYFNSNFHAMEIFDRSSSAILEDGHTLILASKSSNRIFLVSEEVLFSFRRELFVFPNPVFTTVPLPSTTTTTNTNNNTTVANTISRLVGTIRDDEADGDALKFMPVTVAYVQIRNNILFAIKPISPYRSMKDVDIASSTSYNISTEVLFRRRWQFAHPELPSSSVHRSPWADLCYCRILPLYGTKSTYPRDSFFCVSTHQYALSIQDDEDKTHLLEYVLQRLQHQYQIVVNSASLAGIHWPRENLTRNAILDISIGHQIHELKIDETGQSISVKRMMHRGMYSNASATHMITYSYLLLNYMKSGFSVREVDLETQIGEKVAFPWEILDLYIQERRRPRLNIFIPTEALRESEACVALLPDGIDAPPVSFAEFVKFIGYRFSVHLATRGHVEWCEDTSELSTNIPDEMDWPDLMSLRYVVLSHENLLTLGRHCVLDHKTGRTVGLEEPAKDRRMSVDIALSEAYNARCHFFLRVSWLVCTAPIVRDWFGSFLINAARYRLRAVPIPNYTRSTRSEFFVSRYTVRVENTKEEPCFRRRLLSLLTGPPYHYFPDIPAMNRHCRLLHISGLCYVTSNPDKEVVARWYENPMLRTAQPEHQQLLQEFIEVVQLVRSEIASS